MHKSKIIERIKSKDAQIGVIGLGYVGLPLAVQTAKAGFTVLGFDVQKSKVDMVNKGQNYIGDVVGEELAKTVKDKKLSATTDYSKINRCDVVIICVPTPLDKYMQPDVTYIKNSADEIVKYRKKPSFIILESTTYPGTTEEILKPILENDGSRLGEDLFIAFSPERVDPGNEKYKTHNTPKVVGGCTHSCNEMGELFYGSILTGGVHTVSSPRIAEMEKLLENIFRLTNIGLVNELAMLCDRMNINIWEVIEAAKTKPYGFMPFYPGPGVGGHCIPIDPFYLTWKAKEYNFNSSLIEACGHINQVMPEYVAEKISRILNRNKKCISGSKILIAGIAYKRNIDDYRESPVLRIIDILEKQGASLVFADPHVEEFKNHDGDKIYKTTKMDRDLLSSVDIVVITTDHDAFNRAEIMEYSRLIYDTRNFIKENNSKVVRL
ncbi:MAG: nucleotide sugar dehydrogenase [Oligoflexia bacterium]|nr:nucleotide sugar dehydrogenase [Oligoflexia bacterium]